MPVASAGLATDPQRIPRRLESALRREGLKVKQERARGHVALTVWTGALGAPLDQQPADPLQGLGRGLARDLALPKAVSFRPEVRERLDRHDREQVVLTLTRQVLDEVPQPRLWLTRSGSPDPCPEDLSWFAAADETWRSLGLAPDYAVVTREGWCLLPSGLLRRWRRLR